MQTTQTKNNDPKITSRKTSKKNVILLLMAIVLGSLIAIVAGYFIIKSITKNNLEISKSNENTKGVFYEINEMVINLANNDNQKHYLKLSLVIRLNDSKEKDEVHSSAPLIQDSIYTFAKELRKNDFTGSGSTMRLKEELMKRINKVIYPIEVKDLLFKEMLID